MIIRGIKNLISESKDNDGYTVGELIKELKKLDPNKRVVYLDTRDLIFKQEIATPATYIKRFYDDSYLIR